MTTFEPQPIRRKLKKKGGWVSQQDRQSLFEAIQRRETAIPGELARELGWARSSLIYHLKGLQQRGLILKTGGGRSTRYKATTQEKWQRHWHDKDRLTRTFPKPALSRSKPSAETPVPQPQPEVKGLKGFLKKLWEG